MCACVCVYSIHTRRYPHRNDALGRTCTPEESAWLADVDNLPMWAKSQTKAKPSGGGGVAEPASGDGVANEKQDAPASDSGTTPAATDAAATTTDTRVAE